jgi:phosphatidate cytidylyltransferase
MSYRQQTLVIFAALGGLLLVASLLGWLLKRFRAKGAPHAVIDNLNARIYGWWVMVAVMGLAFALGRSGVMVLFAFVSFSALREFITITYTRRGDHFALALSFFFFLPLQFYLVWLGWYGMYSILIPVYAFLALPIVATFSGDTTRFLERTAKVHWGLMVSVYCISHVPALLTLEIPGYQGRQLLLIVFLVLVVQGSDVLQYVWGTLLGKHLIAPRLSAAKTTEGFLGGVLSASVLGAALHWITPFGVWQAGAIALLVTLVGFLGGLVMSAVKRDRGIKDWGAMIEGHGGMLDRVDSVCFAAPIFFHVTRFFYGP